jgi:hypothetical protein
MKVRVDIGIRVSFMVYVFVCFMQGSKSIHRSHNYTRPELDYHIS